MSVTIADLAGCLRAFFADKIPSSPEGTGPGDVLLVFDALGRPLPVGEFLGTDEVGISGVLAHQRAAELADQIPSRAQLQSGSFLAGASTRLSRLYEAIVTGATPASTDPALLPGFEVGKSRARSVLEQNRLVSVSSAVGGPGGTVAAGGTHDYYYATAMSPVDWYRQGDHCWQRFEIGAADDPPPAAAASGSPVVIEDFSFTVVDSVVAEELTRLDPLRSSPCPVDTLVVDSITLDPRPRFERFVEVEKAPIFVRPTLASPQLTVEALTVEALTMPRFFVSEEQKGESGPVLAESLLVDSGPKFTDLRLAEGLAEAATQVAATASSMHVSFDYCLVRFERPWWDALFMSSRNWSLPGFAPGELSRGEAGACDGAITLVTIGMLVVRNLVISAVWSEEDSAALMSSVSLGPFSLSGSGFDSSKGEIRIDGMQAVAWLCEVPPVLPPR